MSKANPTLTESRDDATLRTIEHVSALAPMATLDSLGVEASEYVYLEEITTGPRYTRSSLHAAGGMGNVWLARDAAIGRDVAIKELRADGAAANRARARFVREAKITGQLEHPGVVPVYELGRDAQTGRPFYVMRFVRGRTLTEVAREFHERVRPGWYESMELVNLLSAFVSVCNTVAYAHSRGIIHRDLKGENIVLGEFGEVIVLDWGLAKRLDGEDEQVAADEPDSVLSIAAGATMAGQVIGTPAYVAPEQAEGRLDLIDKCTDVFGLGAILYEILTGMAPFAADSAPEAIRKAIRAEVLPPRVHWPDVPRGLETTCLKALAKAPADRFPTASALGQEVQGWQDRERRQAEDELRQSGERLLKQQAALVSLTQNDLFAGASLNANLRRLVEVAARTLSVERVSIWRFTEDRREIRCQVLYELSTGQFSSGAELAADAYPNYFKALAATQVIAADDARQDSRTCEFRDGYLVPLGIGAMMEVPVPPDGVLCHEHVGGVRKWLPDEQLFGIAVGHLAAHAISHSERRHALEKMEGTGSA